MNKANELDCIDTKILKKYKNNSWGGCLGGGGCPGEVARGRLPGGGCTDVCGFYSSSNPMH